MNCVEPWEKGAKPPMHVVLALSALHSGGVRGIHR